MTCKRCSGVRPGSFAVEMPSLLEFDACGYDSPCDACSLPRPGRLTYYSADETYARGRADALRELRESEEWQEMKRVSAAAWADEWDMSAWDDLCELVEGKKP